MKTLPLQKRISEWYGLWGSSLAWLGHFLSSYLIAEFGCVSSSLRQAWLGASQLSWLVILACAFFFFVAAFSTFVAFKNSVKAQEETRAFTQKSGVILGLIFSFIIFFQTIPVFFFLTSCG